VQRTLVTVVTEGVLESRIVAAVKRLGAHGYTVTDARGEGSRGKRSAEWEHSRNIRLETICEEEVAQAIAQHLRETYYDNFAMIIFLSEVEISRPEKF